MTEALWVAIVGIVGTIVGTILGGFLTYLNTKTQNKARVIELQQQFENERKAVQTARLIEKRAPYLGPINEQQQSIISSIHNIEKKLRDLVFACGDDNVIAWADSRTLGYLQDITNSITSISTATDNIEMLRVRNSDRKLAEYLVKTIKLTIDISKETMKLRRLIIKHGESNTGNNPNKEISAQCICVLNLTPKFNENIRECSKRIEEILSGIE